MGTKTISTFLKVIILTFALFGLAILYFNINFKNILLLIAFSLIIICIIHDSMCNSRSGSKFRDYIRRLFGFDNKDYLSSLIKIKKEEIRKKKTKTTFNHWLKKLADQIYWPSKASLIIVIIVIVMLFLLSHYDPVLKFNHDTHYQNLIAIYAGVSAIIFALIIFIAESSKDHNDKGRVLLKVSYLYPILIASLLGFLNFLWGDISFISILFIIGIVIAVIYSVSRLISVLLNKYQFSEEYLNLLKDRFKRSMESAIDERVGNNILVEALENNNLRHGFLSLQNKPDFHIFYSDKKGIIKDVNLSKIREFHKIAYKEANKNGYFLKKDKISTSDSYNEYLHPFFLKRFKDTVDEGSELIAINKRMIKNQEIIGELENIHKDIFLIGKNDNFSKQVRLELKDIKDEFNNSIRNITLGKVEEYRNIYFELSDTFLGILTEFGGGYNFEQARSERSNFLFRKDEFSWLSEDVNEILVAGLESSSQDIIREVGFLPVHLAHNSISIGDHYIFQQFIDSVISIYKASLKKSDDDLKSFMLDRSWRYLKDTANLIEYKMEEKEADAENLINLKDFAIYILIVFQYLLEESVKNDDLNGFKIFLPRAKKLFENFKPSEDYPTSKDLKWELNNINPSGTARKKMEEQIEHKMILEEIELEINNKKNQMLFGLATWIFQL